MDPTASQELPGQDLPELKPQAEEAMSSRSVPGVFTYPVACLLVALSSSYGTDHPALVSLLFGAILLVAVARLHLSRRFAPIYRQSPRRWRALFGAGLIATTLLWSAFSSLAFLFYGVSWAAFLCLLITTTISAMAVIVFAQSLRLVGWVLVSMLVPHIGVGLYHRGADGFGVALALSVYLIYLAIEARHLHEELWRGLAHGKLLDVRARELNEARAQAESARDAQSRFLANISHELRTPLAGILGMSELLVTGEDPSKRRQYSKTIHSTAELLLGLVDDILDLAKIEAGKLSLESVDFSLHRAIHGVVELLEPRAREKGIVFELELADDLPDWLVGDSLRLRQVLINLIGNAIKFTPRGKVGLAVRARSAEGRIWLRFTVRDTGIGMDENEQRKIFSAFAQADLSTSRRFGGTGLGLAICKRIVDLQGGEIGLQSASGIGSTFWCRIPYEPSRLPPEERIAGQVYEPTSAELRLRQRDACRVLLAEDNEVNQLVALHMLTDLGFSVDCVANGTEALAALEGQRYDVVLMDCMMPDLDGYEATLEIRRREKGNRHTPIIAMTAHALEEDREKCLGVGMDDYLSKPFRRESLFAALDRWLTTADAQTLTGGEAPPAPVSPGAGEPALLDPEQIESLRRVGGDKVDVLAKVAKIFLRRGRSRIAELRQAVSAGDTQSMRLCAHGLKGSSANLGAREMAEICGEIEVLALQGADVDYEAKVRAAEDALHLVEQELLRLVPALQEATAEADT